MSRSIRQGVILGGSQRVDFRSRDWFKHRALLHIHDKVIGTSSVFKVNFDTDFDKFGANVAFALRGMVVYRTDGGKFARGLVRASGDLLNIYRDLKDAKLRTGDAVRLVARVFRRVNPLPGNHWVMSIQFAHVAEDMISDDTGDNIIASEDVSRKANQNFMEAALPHAAAVFSDKQRFPGERGDRIRKWLDLAQRLGWPHNFDMWYYARPAVNTYIKWETAQPDEENNPNSKRRRMTATTSGKMPFDGNTGSPTQIDWRIFPFRNALNMCKGRDPDCLASAVVNELIHDEDEILRTYAEIDKEIGRVSSLPSFDPYGGNYNPFKKGVLTSNYASSLGPLAFAFLNHFYSLGKDENTLYSVFKPKDSFWKGTVGP